MRTIAAVFAAVVVAMSTAGASSATRGIWLTAPVNGATVPPAETVTLEYGTDWLTGVFPGRLKLEVARDAAFSDLAVEAVYTCPAGFVPSCPGSSTVGPLALGTYHWRILWYAQPDGLPASWVPSDTWSFVVGGPDGGASPNEAPTARIVAATTSVQVGESIRFDGAQSSDADGTIVSYSWDFGNGNGAAGTPLVGVTYDRPGTFHVKLVVVDDDGGVGEAAVDVSVREPDAAPPPSPPQGPPVPPPTTPSPPIPPAARDTSAPVVAALAGTARAGGTAKLWYRVRDDSGRASVELTLSRRGRTIARLARRIAPATNDPSYVLWRVPSRAGLLALCVRARDSAGNASALRCAPFRVR